MGKVIITAALAAALGIGGVFGNKMRSMPIQRAEKPIDANIGGHDDFYFATLHLGSAYALLADGREDVVERYRVGGKHNTQSNRERAIMSYEKALGLLDEKNPRDLMHIGVAYDGLAALHKKAENAAKYEEAAKERDAFYRDHPEAKIRKPKPNGIMLDDAEAD